MTAIEEKLQRMIQQELEKTTPEILAKMVKSMSKAAINEAVKDRADAFFTAKERTKEIDDLLMEAWERLVRKNREKLVERLSESIADDLSANDPY